MKKTKKQKNVIMKKTIKKPLVIAFGSQVSGHATPQSDFDLAVLDSKPLTLDETASLSQYLAKKMKLNEDMIDLVDLHKASPLLTYEVAQKGRLIEGSDFDFTRFKVRAWKNYHDTEKFRRLRSYAMEKYVKGLHT